MTTAYDRFREWLETSDLAEIDADEAVNIDQLARTCIENFVIICENPTDGDLENFLGDIKDFSEPLQKKLIEGFIVTYGMKDAAYEYCLN